MVSRLHHIARGGWPRPTCAALVILLGLTVPQLPLRAASERLLGQGAGVATLTILAASVETAAGTAAFVAAQDGQTVTVGDLVRTGAGGAALLTFFDGSQTQLQANTQVQVNTAPDAPNGAGLFQFMGTTVNRVQQLTGGTFVTDSAVASAFVRGTTYLVDVHAFAADGSLTAIRLPAPTPLPEFPRVVRDSPYLVIAEELYLDGGTTWRHRTWLDPTDGSTTWDTYEETGPGSPGAPSFPAQGSGLAGICRYTGNGRAPYVFLLIAANSPESSALRPGDLAGARSVADCPQTSQTSAILLPDPKGHLGTVQIQGNGSPLSWKLDSPGAVGASDGAILLHGVMNPTALATLLQRTANLVDATGAAAAGTQMQGLAAELHRTLKAGKPDAVGTPQVVVDEIRVPVGTGTAVATAATVFATTAPAPGATVTPAPGR